MAPKLIQDMVTEGGRGEGNRGPIPIARRQMQESR